MSYCLLVSGEFPVGIVDTVAVVEITDVTERMHVPHIVVAVARVRRYVKIMNKIKKRLDTITVSSLIKICLLTSL